MELQQRQLSDALGVYWDLREQRDGLDPLSSYDMGLRQPELESDLTAASYLVACAADDLLAELAVA